MVTIQKIEEFWLSHIPSSELVQYTKLVSVKTQLRLENRVYISKRATCFYLAYVILKLQTILNNKGNAAASVV